MSRYLIVASILTMVMGCEKAENLISTPLIVAAPEAPPPVYRPHADQGDPSSQGCTPRDYALFALCRLDI